MKYFKYIILAVVIIIIIIISVILYIMNNGNYIYVDEQEETDFSTEIDRVVSEVSIRNNYYAVKSIIENYYYDLTQFNMTEDDVWVFETDDEENVINTTTLTESIEAERQAYINKVYNYLREEYIEENNITLNNLQSKLGNYNDVVVFIENMYSVDANEDVRVYFVEGSVVEKSTLETTDFEMTVYVDSQNSAFELYPGGYTYDIQIGEELILDIEKIENNTYNKYTYNIIDDETHSSNLFKDYINGLIYNTRYIYNKLNEEYRETKFGSFAEFTSYVEDNYYKLITPVLNSYQRTEEEDYTQYVLLASNEKYYIFYETAIMQYELILDTYTIDIPEFTERYNSVTTQEKVILNINKFMLAINDGDYKYVYRVLADSFKTNNFPTYESFETYMKNTFFEENEFDYVEFGDEGGTYYTYRVNITDASETSSNTISKTFIMLLGEGTDFELSFNVS